MNAGPCLGGARHQVRRFVWLFGRVWTDAVLLPLKAVWRNSARWRPGLARAGRGGRSYKWLSAVKALHAAQQQRRSNTNPVGSEKAPRSPAGALNALGPLFFVQLAYQIAGLRQIN